MWAVVAGSRVVYVGAVLTTTLAVEDSLLEAMKLFKQLFTSPVPQSEIKSLPNSGDTGTSNKLLYDGILPSTDVEEGGVSSPFFLLADSSSLGGRFSPLQGGRNDNDLLLVGWLR